MAPSSLSQPYTPSSLFTTMSFSGCMTPSQPSASSSTRDYRPHAESEDDASPTSSDSHSRWSAESSPIESLASTESDDRDCGSDEHDEDGNDDKPSFEFSVHPATPDRAMPTPSPSPAISKSKFSPSAHPVQPPALHPYRGSSAPAPRLRPRGLTPLSSLSNLPPPVSSPGLPKSQPLARALFARLTDVPHAGSNAGGKKKGPQKLIVPTKAFRTTFELDLTASEFARKQ